jgi:general secretion pathway protein G
MRHVLRNSQRAFTLVELIVVVAVLTILAAMAIPQFNQYRDKAKSSASAADIRALEKAVIAYVLDKNSLPATLADAGVNQLDPWQRAYVYAAPGTLEYSVGGGITLNTDFDLYSTGADGLSTINSGDQNSLDDIVRSNDGGFAGTRAGL